MIREDTSWGGRERDCVHLACGDGSFVDVSAAAQLDWIEDGRALARLDFDRDGSPDLVLRGRGAPQLRLLRNRTPAAGRVLWLRLEGRDSNRDAIGARVTVDAGEHRRAREVTAGHAFISQSSRWLDIAFGESIDAARITVRWPSGRVDEHESLSAERRWILVEGSAPRADAVASRLTPVSAGDGAEARPQNARNDAAAARTPDGAIATWLLDPVPAPALAGLARDGAFVGDAIESPGPLVVHFISRNCAVCVVELPGLVAALPELARAGASALFVALDVDTASRDTLDFVPPLPATAAAITGDRSSVAAWNIIHRRLSSWRRDIVTPTSFLLDASRRIVKVYRGRTPVGQFARDVVALPRSEAERRRLALPFAGRTLSEQFRRDVPELAAALADAGLPALAAATYASIGTGNAVPDDSLDSTFNHAVAAAAAGDTATARRLYEEILAVRPDFDDASNNLGVIEAREGRLAAAREHFARTLASNPAHADAVLNLANSWLGPDSTPQDWQRARDIFVRALEHDPRSPRLLERAWYAYYRTGDRETATRTLRAAIEVEPDNVDAHLNLAVLSIAEGAFEEAAAIARAGLRLDAEHAPLRHTLGMALQGLDHAEEAIDELRRSIASDPRFDRASLGLARLLSERGDSAGAIAVVESFLRVVPEHPEARALLDLIRGAQRAPR